MGLPNPAPDWLDTAEYPFEAKYFSVPAGKMHYIDEGEGEQECDAGDEELAVRAHQ